MMRLCESCGLKDPTPRYPCDRCGVNLCAPCTPVAGPVLCAECAKSAEPVVIPGPSISPEVLP